MIDPVKKAYDIASITKDIDDRKQIIKTYLATGYLDREKAINKIIELRTNNKYVLAVTLANSTGVPLSNTPDEMLVNDLQMQVNMLEAEVMKKGIEN